MSDVHVRSRAVIATAPISASIELNHNYKRFRT